MKIKDAPKELKDKCEFACLVCREQHKLNTGKSENCSCRAVLNEYCPTMEKVINSQN